MKTVVVSYIILAVVLLVVIVNSIIISNSIDTILEKLKGIPEVSSAGKEYQEVFDDYMAAQRFLGITVSHDDLTNIEGEFYEILGAAEAGDDESLVIAKSRLMGALTHLRRLCGINADSILFSKINLPIKY